MFLVVFPFLECFFQNEIPIQINIFYHSLNNSTLLKKTQDTFMFSPFLSKRILRLILTFNVYSLRITEPSGTQFGRIFFILNYHFKKIIGLLSKIRFEPTQNC